MKIYYETAHRDTGDFPILTAHDTLDNAIQFAEANGITTIYQIGGSYDEYEKCEWCDEWHPIEELKNGLCRRCRQAAWSRGEEWQG